MNAGQCIAIPARALVVEQVDEMRCKLSSFPVDSLIDYCFENVDEGAPSSRRRWLVEQILARWAAILARDMERFPVTTDDSVERIRQRTVDAHAALDNLRTLVAGLEHFATDCSATCWMHARYR